jgi:hypothetical protein
MRDEIKSYIAGIIDGEGSIMLISNHKNQLPSPCISISSSTIELLEWIKSATNVGTIIKKKNYNPEYHKNSYTYYLRNDKALWLLSEIYPYLVLNSKKKRARLLLSEYKNVTLRNGRYTEATLNAKNDFYERFIGL